MIRLIIYLAVAYLVFRWWKSKRKKDEIRDTMSGRKPLESAELVQDPQCGVYFVKDRGVKTDINGETYYFCSEECRKAFLARTGTSEER
ncbi:YHS domain-containing protein [Thermodesulforhabdus norvegica]|uniref:YHS domain-containing protein n=1 Tax=Thermodesulforhabdus norvegica TaxID=39841 RepID=A0A1I4W4K5_9BACT|nr:YHS domain-containing protein [Thermodesulforhabdus norvegica]SFN08518.1 YHS domain-containing protein [Thermodesulforhabdus norvegica]